MATEAKRRVAIVVQRYGEEINGGAELEARMVAERLAHQHQVEVLTSCALEYQNWGMDYAPGPCEVRGIPVIRFAHPLRNDLGRARVALRHKLRFLLRRVLSLLPGPAVAPARGDERTDGEHFLRRQGPWCEGLYEHLRQSGGRYDAVIFFAALYAPAATGLRVWGRRSILVPLLHDEKPMYQPVYRSVFQAAGALLFNTPAERRLASRLYGLDTHADPVFGVGLSVREPAGATRAAVRERWQLRPGYLVYVGRIDTAKGCRELLDAFLTLHGQAPQAQLVLVGKAVMELPTHPAIVPTGFVSDAERDALIAEAGALVIPSRYESLSLVLLEAMLLRTPVIANAACEVLADHIRESGGGVAYGSPRELVQAMRTLPALGAAERQRMTDAGAAYVQRSCNWDTTLAIFDQAIEKVSRLRG
jgi:glycosyltransferase involved in cell wall biosynthesis